MKAEVEKDQKSSPIVRKVKTSSSTVGRLLLLGCSLSAVITQSVTSACPDSNRVSFHFMKIIL